MRKALCRPEPTSCCGKLTWNSSALLLFQSGRTTRQRIGVVPIGVYTL